MVSTAASQHEGCGFSLSGLCPIYGIPVSVWFQVLGKNSSPLRVLVCACSLIRSPAKHKPGACAINAIRDLCTMKQGKEFRVISAATGPGEMQHGIPVSFQPSGLHLQRDKSLINTYFCTEAFTAAKSKHLASCEAMCAGPRQSHKERLMFPPACGSHLFAVFCTFQV